MPSYIEESFAAGSIVADQRDRARRAADDQVGRLIDWLG
jgi:hypothetical protein